MNTRGVNHRPCYEGTLATREEEFVLAGVPLSDFVYPSWFEIFRKPGSTQFDHLKRVTRPFQILPGGYMSVFQSGKWTQIFGSKAKAARFAREDRRGHRSMYRGRPDRMKPSRPTARSSTKRRPQSR